MTSFAFADSAKRVEQKVADQNLTNKVEPTVPPLAKTWDGGHCGAGNHNLSRREGYFRDRSKRTSMLAPAFVDAVKNGSTGHSSKMGSRQPW